MGARNLLAGCAACVLMAGCLAPKAVPVVERGRRIDRATLELCVRGVSTRAQVLELLGPPSTTSSNPMDGSITCSWDYFHSDARGSTAIMTILKFGPDDLLEIKLVNQNSQLHP